MATLLEDFEHFLEPVGVTEFGLLEEVSDPVVDDECLGSLLELVEKVMYPLQDVVLGSWRQALDAAGDCLPILPGEVAQDPRAELAKAVLTHADTEFEHLLAEDVALHQENQKHRLRLEGDQVQVLHAA